LPMNHPKPKTRIVIADDHAVVRAGLRSLIHSQPDMEVVGEAGDAPTALAVVRSLKPDVVLLDITMPGGGGLKAQEQIAAVVPGARILILSMHSDTAFVRTAMAAGAAGYVSKKTVHTELLNAVRAIRSGRRYVDAAVSEGLLPATPRYRQVLSGREEQALRLIASGYTNQEIADRLFVSVKTVETYRARIMSKLELKSRAELVQYAINAGLLGRDLE
jgi:two-component system, NarL family, response regulator NreC